MAWWSKLFRWMTPLTNVAQVTSNRFWRCPKCNTNNKKTALGKAFHPGWPVSRVGGSSTCPHCLTVFETAEIYCGKYDVEVMQT